ncbi:MAG: hypothetical protein V1736_06655 [Pseudomonadota bacterium]
MLLAHAVVTGISRRGRIRLKTRRGLWDILRLKTSVSKGRSDGQDNFSSLSEKEDSELRQKLFHKLRQVILCVGLNTDVLAEVATGFLKKVRFLSDLKRYDELVGALLGSYDLTDFNCRVFEVLFAHDFEMKGRKLHFDLNNSPAKGKTGHFCYDANGSKLHFCPLSQTSSDVRAVDPQLMPRKSHDMLSGEDAQKEGIIRIQNFMIKKHQDHCRKAKLHETGSANYFVVVNVSDLNLDVFDRYDCMLTVHGGPGVPVYYRRDILGLCQELPPDNKYFSLFRDFRETVSGVLFVKFTRTTGVFDRLFVNRDLQYFFVPNNSLLNNEELDSVAGLISFLKPWP